jgi:uncharacterized protein
MALLDGNSNRRIDAKSARLTVTVAEGIDQVAREAWDALLTSGDSPFLEWDWLSALEQSKSAARQSGWSPSHLVVKQEPEGRIIAACPLYLKSHSMGEFIFDHGWAQAAERAGLRYYPKILAGIPFTPHTGRRFLTAADFARGPLVELLGRALVSLCRENKFSSVHVNFCQEDEAQALTALGFLERLGYQYHWRNDGFANFDDYLDRLKHKRRYAIRHERSAMAQQGVSIRTLVGEQIPDRTFGPMFELYRSTIEKLYWGRQYLNRRFFDLMGANFKRRLCLVCAYHGDELIAGTFNLQKAGVLYGRYWGCFRELRFLHFNVCYYAAIEHCISAGISRFEPGAGGEYKWLRGFAPALTRSAHFIVHPGLRKAVRQFLDEERREVTAWIAAGTEHGQLKAPPPSNAEVP